MHNNLNIVNIKNLYMTVHEKVYVPSIICKVKDSQIQTINYKRPQFRGFI